MKTEEQLKAFADEVYSLGFQNGAIEMKNKILKSVNRDWKLVTIKTSAGLVIEILKKIQKIKVQPPLLVKLRYADKWKEKN